MNRIWLNELQLNDGNVISLDKNDIVVFVGPNNAGKSASLKEIYSLLGDTRGSQTIITKIVLQNEGDADELVLSINNFSRKTNDKSNPTYEGFNFSLKENDIRRWWSNGVNGMGPLRHIFANLLSTEGRLGAANPPANISITTDSPNHPIHFLQKDDSLEEQFNKYFIQAFGTNLILHRNAGSEVPFFIGDKPALEVGEDRISINYLRKLEALPKLQYQGDGMRSFVGVLLNAFISTYSIQLIDEPEAFLHPPQARLLGKMLAKDLPNDRQLFLSTHSEDFLKGILDSGHKNIKIIRIRREDNVNHSHLLNNNDIQQIWSDSLLRHSNILSGLFHTQTVICESDSDCRFYSAVLNAIYDDSGKLSPDILFTHCGGKHRIPTAIKALKQLGVPLVAVVDFDIFNDETPLKDIVLNLGGDFNTIKKDWRIVKDSIDSKRPELETADLREEIDKIFELTTERIIPKDKIQEIGKLLKRASPWSHAKEAGKVFIPSGDASVAYNQLINYLEAIGLLVVEVGELERFVKSVGGHGPKWVNEVLAKDLKVDSELEEARKFVMKMI